MVLLKNKITFDFDCIVALKRSGWFLGAFLSNQTGKPVFTESEIKSIPEKFNKILIVDDKICKGKSMQKAINQLNKKEIKTAAMYVEGNVLPDFHAENLNGRIVKMWYEVPFFAF